MRDLLGTDKIFVKMLIDRMDCLTAEGLAVFENHILDSSNLGKRMFVVVGPKCTFRTKELAETQGSINTTGLASTRMEFTGYLSREEIVEYYESI